MGKRVIERPHRLPRQAYVGHVTFAFTLCLDDRTLSLLAESSVRAIHEALEAIVAEYEVTVPIALLMPDHMHLMLQGNNERSDLKTALERFKFKTGWWFYRSNLGLRWQKNYYDHAPRGDDAWRKHARYIAENPVRKGLTKDCSEWPYVWAVGHNLREVLYDGYDR
ncbi:MAG: transposase [Fimbriimonadaceae bacterium]|nr:transposase [Fimbriimonadaceae bacterium]